jgi:hypothetical protein
MAVPVAAPGVWNGYAIRASTDHVQILLEMTTRRCRWIERLGLWRNWIAPEFQNWVRNLPIPDPPIKAESR